MFKLEATTEVTIRQGMQSGSKPWAKIAFEYIGAKTADLARVHAEIERDGYSQWEGFTLGHPLAS